MMTNGRLNQGPLELEPRLKKTLQLRESSHIEVYSILAHHEESIPG